MLLQTLQAVGYLTLLAILLVLWGQVIRRREPRNFWLFFAWAWTMNLLGNIAWIVHDLVTGAALSTFSLVDVFYIVRYALVGLALWLYPVALTQKTWKWVGSAALITAVLVWAFYFRSAMATNGGDWIGFLGLALYPMFDAVLIVVAWQRARASRETIWHGTAWLLFCAVTSYGIANTLNLTEYVFPPLSGGIVPNIFWILTDVFLLVMALSASSRKKEIRD
ncbi:MAG: hypothetical protein IPM31_06335 [Anaerolineae bacterium]|nr:hypothetical protein [Anaerolineae bacterium]MBL8105094.1 hypothetical protein [Anaerolineales bacterium]